jgi:hypothetical protein
LTNPSLLAWCEESICVLVGYWRVRGTPFKAARVFSLGYSSMAIGSAWMPRQRSRLQRLIDRYLPIAALAAIGFLAIVTSAILLRVADSVLAPPFSSYTAGQNPWTAVMNRPISPANAVAFSPTKPAAH